MAERRQASKFRSELKNYFELLDKRSHIRCLMDARNTQKKPYDSFYVQYSRFVAIEFKEVKGLTVRGDLLVNHQVEGLLEADRSGARSTGLIVVFFKHKELAGTCLICTIKNWLRIFCGVRDENIFEWHNVSVKAQTLKDDIRCEWMERAKFKGVTMWKFIQMRRYIQACQNLKT